MLLSGPQDTERCYEVRNEDVFKSPNYIERILEILNGMNARPMEASERPQ